MKLFDGETKLMMLEDPSNSALGMTSQTTVLTNFRVIREVQQSGSFGCRIIWLDDIVYVGFNKTSSAALKLLTAFAAFASVIATLVSLTDQGQVAGGFACMGALVTLAFLTAYLVSRTQTLKISSAAGEIVAIHNQTLQADRIRTFVTRLDEARHELTPKSLPQSTISVLPLAEPVKLI